MINYTFPIIWELMRFSFSVKALLAAWRIHVISDSWSFFPRERSFSTVESVRMFPCIVSDRSHYSHLWRLSSTHLMSFSEHNCASRSDTEKRLSEFYWIQFNSFNSVSQLFMTASCFIQDLLKVFDVSFLHLHMIWFNFRFAIFDDLLPFQSGYRSLKVLIYNASSKERYNRVSKHVV